MSRSRLGMRFVLSGHNSGIVLVGRSFFSALVRFCGIPPLVGPACVASVSTRAVAWRARACINTYVTFCARRRATHFCKHISKSPVDWNDFWMTAGQGAKGAKYRWTRRIRPLDKGTA